MIRTAVRHLKIALVGILLSTALWGCTDDKSPKTACIHWAYYGESTVYRRDYQYAWYRFFDIGRVGNDPVLESGDQIVRFELYELIDSLDVTRGQGGVAFEDVRSPGDNQYTAPIRGRFDRLGSVGIEWVLVTEDPSWEFPYIKFLQSDPSMEFRSLAYYLEIDRAGTRVTFGNLSNDVDSLELQLLKLSNPRPEDPFWDAQWKNVYDLRLRNIDYNEFQLDIYKGQPGDEWNPANPNHQNTVPYIQMLGLDRINQSGASGADGRIDNDPAVLDLELGLLIFPDRRPFDTDVGYSPNPAFADSILHERVPEIYETSNYTQLQKSTKYYFRIDYGLRTADLYVGHPYLVPDSDILTFNGQRLFRAVVISSFRLGAERSRHL